MSRSFKKTPMLVTKCKGYKKSKRISNKRVRVNSSINSKGTWYRKMLNSCEIIDQREYMSYKMFNSYVKAIDGYNKSANENKWKMSKNYYEHCFKRK